MVIWCYYWCASIAFSEQYVKYVDRTAEKTPTDFKPNVFDLSRLFPSIIYTDHICSHLFTYFFLP